MSISLPRRSTASSWCAFRPTRLTRWPSTRSLLFWRSTAKFIAHIIGSAKVISLSTGLVGFDMHGKTVGVIGTGQIGTVVAQILTGFGCPTLAFDPFPNATCRSLGVRYVELNELFAQSDIISLHCPLTPENKYIINDAAIARMKNGVMLINTSRGALLDTVSIIDGLKSGKIGYLGLDVYEEEEEIFFEDRSGLILSDDVFARLLTFPNVIITGHQAFFTREALLNIAATTIDNITKFENNQPLEKLAG